MESHRHWCFTTRFRHQPLETICCTHRPEWSCTTYFVFCLEFLYQVGASSANSNPGADEHDGLFWKFISRKVGRDTLSPLVAMPSPWSCMCVGNFLKLLCSPTVASEPRFYALMLYAWVEHKWVVGDTSHTAYQHVILWFGGIVRWSGPDGHYAYAYARLVSPLRALLLKGGWRVSVSLTLVEADSMKRVLMKGK